MGLRRAAPAGRLIARPSFRKCWLVDSDPLEPSRWNSSLVAALYPIRELHSTWKQPPTQHL